MAKVKSIIDFACRDLGLSDNETREQIRVSVQRAWYRLIRKHPWQFCRRSVAITGTEDGAQGSILPANMVHIIDPVYDSDGVRYYPKDTAGNPNTVNSRWYSLDATAVTPLVEENNVLAIEEGATAYAGGTWAAAYIGEYVTFGDQPGAYLLTDTRTISEKYWGPRIAGGAIIIRPRGTMRLSLIDGDGSRLGDAVTVHYWAYPAPLYHEWQDIPEHLEQALQWATVMESKGFTIDQKKGLVNTVYDKMFTGALDEAIAADPAPHRTFTPVDNRGLIRTMGRRNTI